ncbi:MAG: ADP-ribosylglycohydrolase family protein, partial [Kamptonema sp. SIO4C4]|nr:ADP-ribosylglycohydrolase family protein [Kamptonema sp. SIO4C4]
TIACIAGGIAEAFYGGVPAAIAEQVWRRLDDDLANVVKQFQLMIG